jgi:hypothetical protein
MQSCNLICNDSKQITQPQFHIFFFLLGIAQAKEFEDPPGLLEKTEYLLREWVNAYHARDAGKDSRQAFVVFVQLMNQHGKTDFVTQSRNFVT